MMIRVSAKRAIFMQTSWLQNAGKLHFFMSHFWGSLRAAIKKIKYRFLLSTVSGITCYYLVQPCFERIPEQSGQPGNLNTEESCNVPT